VVSTPRHTDWLTASIFDFDFDFDCLLGYLIPD
jgi:hypothetical protein